MENTRMLYHVQARTKILIKLCLCLIKHHAVWPHTSYPTSALEGGEWSTSSMRKDPSLPIGEEVMWAPVPE
jgi:hypothetical protein